MWFEQIAKKKGCQICYKLHQFHHIYIINNNIMAHYFKTKCNIQQIVHNNISCIQFQQNRTVVMKWFVVILLKLSSTIYQIETFGKSHEPAKMQKHSNCCWCGHSSITILPNFGDYFLWMQISKGLYCHQYSSKQ